ncbi:MAG: TolC family protein [bacterium]
MLQVCSQWNGRLAGSCVVTAALILAWGCASVQETTLRERHRREYSASYRVSDTTNRPVCLDENSTIDDYIAHAFARNPSLRAAFDRWEAAIEGIPQARALENPALSFEYFAEQRDLRYQVGIEQMLPAFGKLGLRDRLAVAEAEAAAREFEVERFKVYDGVVKAFYEYRYLECSIEATGENLRLMADLEKVLASRYGAGTAGYSEVIKVQLEKDRLASELASLNDERGARSAALSALLSLPAREVLPWPKDSPAGQPVIDETVLAGMLEDLNPELKAADAMIAAAQTRVELAEKNLLPDFTVGASWMVMAGKDGHGDEADASLVAGITLPIWRAGYRAGIREAAAMARAVASERDDRRNTLRAELSMAVAKHRDADRRASLFASTLVPKAATALDVARQGFAAGQVDFMTLIDAQRTLLDFTLQADRAAADREIANAEIRCRIGRFGNLPGGAGTVPAVEK